MRRSELLKSLKPERQKKIISPATRRRWHVMGFIFLALAILTLIWDCYNLTQGLGLASFSGVVDVWAHFHSSSLRDFEYYIVQNLGATVWHDLLYPVMNFPAVVVFSVLGGIYLRAGRPEIALREPSMTELMMVQQGYNPRKELRNRGMSVGS